VVDFEFANLAQDFLTKVHDVEPIAWLASDWAKRFSEKENMAHAAVAGNILNVWTVGGSFIQTT
jgi:hypothetical protein